jgi:ketosteroid isomerase-like protein
MRITRRTAALVLAGLAAGAGARATAEDAPVLDAQDRRLALTVAADIPALSAMMTDDLTYTHANAVVESKAEFLDALRTGRYRYRSTTFEDRRVRLHGEAAIVSGTCRVRVVAGGNDVDVRLRFTELYVREGGAWKMALWQSTRVPDPAR